jgi:hypothetical protein
MAFSREGVDDIEMFYVDEDTDIDTLPTDPDIIKTGSKAYVVDNGNLYMFKSNTQEWKLQ